MTFDKPHNQSLFDSINQKYYPSLNGLRGISIILVVLYHLQIISANLGHLGVNIFFVLSGFLITSLCIKEQEKTGKLILKSFYIRRILRIFPVAYLYIGVILILNFVYYLQIPWFQFVGASFYVMNFNYFRAHNFTWLTAHYWSLSVEEQFYLLFPVILKLNKKTFKYVLLFIVVVLPLICTLQWLFEPLNKGILYAFTHYFIKFQSIAIGCLFAVLVFEKVFERINFQNTKLIGNILCFAVILYLGYDDFYSIGAVYINGLISLLTGYLIISNLTPAKDLVFKLLNFKALSFIGVLSYSIYIWQQLFTSFDNRLPKFMVAYPFNIVCLILVPIASYYLYEVRFLKLKAQFKRVKYRYRF